MDHSGERDSEVADLRERLSRLSDASRRINESLDFDTVLQEVLDSARSLTGAPYGVMTLTGDSGRIEDFLSSGMTGEETERLWQLPQGPQFIGYLGNIPEPLRVRDLAGHFRSVGLPAFDPPLPVGPELPFLAAPIVQQGARVGNIFVFDTHDGAEFSREDEETLVMFASHAAMVIGNARTYRDERRARTDLETLVNTSPVGVVVFDVKTGAPVLRNREMVRLVDHLREPDQPPEQLLDVLTFVRGDGREISLKELPIAELLRIHEVIRVEEITLRAPNGRSVSALLNATTILSDDGEIETFVVTLQDMTPLEELERLRAEFLGMVSHELRAPLTSIKGSVTTLLEAASELDPAEMTQFFRIIRDQSDQMRYLIGDLLDVARIETGTLSVEPERSDVSSIVDEAVSRFLSTGSRADLRIGLEPGLPAVMADTRRTVQVLSNLLSNAAAYSPEESSILVSVTREGVDVAISVADEGRGIPEDLMPHLFRKFSRPTGVSQGSGLEGSGLGLAICKGIVEAHGGRIWAESEGPGLGARFTFTLPAAADVGIGSGTSPAAVSGGLQGAETPPVRVLVVDDDPQTLRYVRDALTKGGYAPIVTGDPDDVLRLVKGGAPPPGAPRSGAAGARRDRVDAGHPEDARTCPSSSSPCTARTKSSPKRWTRARRDYLVKPFSPTELAARIRAALRKQIEPRGPEPSGPFSAGALSIDYATRRVTLGGQPLELTATEYALLYELSVNARRVLTHNLLLQRVWGPERVGEPWLVRDVVKRLRRKLGDDARNPTYIFTEPRVGYLMAGGTAPDSP